MEIASYSLFVNKIAVQLQNTQAGTVLPLLKRRCAKRKGAAHVIPL